MSKFSDDKIEKVAQLVFDEMNSFYNGFIISAAKQIGEGQRRKQSGDFVEDLLQVALGKISEETGITIESRVGTTDFFKRKITTETGEELSDEKIQVDRHNYINQNLFSVIENKSNLDACYCKRALSDFVDIADSIYENGGDPRLIKYIIFSGQKALDETKRKFLLEDFKKKTTKYYSSKEEIENGNAHGLPCETFFIINGRRQSTKPVYKTNPGLNESEIKRFVRYIMSII